jgi:hypothetical protein
VLARSDAAQVRQLEHDLSVILAAGEKPDCERARRAKHALDRLVSQQPERQAQAGAARQLLVQVERYLQMLPSGVRIEAAAAVPVRLADGEELPAALARVRNDVARLQRELTSARNAPLPKPVMRALAADRVAELARRGGPVIASQGGMFKVSWPQEVMAGEGVAMVSERMPAVLAWLDPGRLLARLEADIDSLPEVAGALSERDRLARIADGAAAARRERIEEALVERAHRSGLMTAARRPLADPRAVLGVNVVSAAAAKAA